MAPELRRQTGSKSVENIALQTFPLTVTVDTEDVVSDDDVLSNQDLEHTLENNRTQWILDFSLENVGSVARDHVCMTR
jgi:hypothetical protein